MKMNMKMMILIYKQLTEPLVMNRKMSHINDSVRHVIIYLIFFIIPHEIIVILRSVKISKQRTNRRHPF